MRSEPAATEQKAGTERGKKDRPAIVARLFRGTSQSLMQGCAARGRAEIAGNLGDRRKSGGGNAGLLGEQGHEARVRLVRRKTPDGAARDAAAQLDGCENFFHAGDRRARKGFAVELHGEAAIPRITDLDGGSVLACAAEEEFTEAIAFVGIVTSCASKDESTGAVAKQTSKFAGDAAGNECSAVDIGGDDGDAPSLSRSDQRLCEHQCVEQTEAGATDIQGATIFTDQQSRMKLRRKRRVIVMCFAGGDDPIELLRSACSCAQRFLCGFCGEC